MSSEVSSSAVSHFRFALPAAVADGTLPATGIEFSCLLDGLSAQVDAYLEAELETRVRARLAAEVDRRVATEVAERVRYILEQIRLARQQRFGVHSEANLLQGRLFNEAEQAANQPESGEAADAAPAGAASQSCKPRGRRHPLPPELPRVEVVVDVPEAQRQCPTCGTPMIRIGEEVREQLNIVPMRIEVIRTVRPRYACPASHTAPVIAPAPAVVLPRTNFTAGFLATLLTTKYVDGLPLYRFEKVLARHGVDVPRQSLARAVIRVSHALQPLANLARDTLLDSTVIHMDETTVQVLKEPGKAPQSKSYMWVQRGGPPGRPVVLYDYDPGRSGQVPVTLLEGWSGYLMTDGYDGYGAIAGREGIEHLVCMAHARRKFVEAKRASPKGKATRADQALAFFGRLYGIERKVKDVDDATRWQARLHRSRPVLKDFRAWLDATRPVVTPKSALGTALAYLDKYWPKLTRYTERGDLPIGNNACENAIRPFVVGRKGWLFSDTQAGARASAVIYSLVETVKANGLEPYTWLAYVLKRLPAATTVEAFEALMPWNLHQDKLLVDLGS